MLGVHVQKAKRAKEKREKGTEETEGDEGLSIPRRWILPPVQPFIYRLPNQVSGRWVPGRVRSLGCWKLARELDLR